MIPGSKGQKSDASLLARGFLTLGPAKNMTCLAPTGAERRPAEAHSAEQSGIKGSKYLLTPTSYHILNSVIPIPLLH